MGPVPGMDEASGLLEFGHGDGEHASVTPLRQKRFFKDLSPPKMSPPDSSDGPISHSREDQKIDTYRRCLQFSAEAGRS